MTPGETRGLLSPLAEAESTKAIAAADRELRQKNINRQLDFQQQALNNQQRAATISGLLQLPLSYGIARQTGLLPNLFGAANAQGGGLLGGSTNLGGSFATGGALAPQASPFTGVGPLSSFEGVGTGLTQGLTTGTALGTAGAGLLGGNVLGPTLNKILPGGGQFGEAVGSGAGGALAGAAAGSILPGVGTLVGSAIGGLVGFVGGLF